MFHIPRKRFGQNFLHDATSIAQILAAIAAQPGQRLVEIGPGQGAITSGLLRAAGGLDAVELDRDLIEPLRARCAALGTLRIHSADALQFDFTALAAGQCLRVVGNLPYNISTPLLFHLLAQMEWIQDMHFLLQKDLVERLAAVPGNKTYGRLTIMVQARCQVQHLFDIGPAAFYPAPRVESACVRLIPHAKPLYTPIEADAFAALVAAAFNQRRKTLRNALKALLAAEQIVACDLDPSTRPEQLTVADFLRLARAFNTASVSALN